MKGFEEQNGTVKWSVKQQLVKLLSVTPKILVTASEFSPYRFVHVVY